MGVTGYKVYRGGTEIASLGNMTSYTDTTVAGSTTYSYTVRAVDAAGNLSDPSNTATTTTPAQTSFTIPAEADARVEQSTPTTNYATSNLRTDSGTNAAPTASCASRSAESWAACKTPSCASTPTPPRWTVRPCTRPRNSWAENTLNWNTRPLRTSAATDDKGAIAANTWVEYNVTPFVTGNGTYSFTIAQTSSDGVDFRAREYTANQPELVLTTGSDSQKPTPPGNLNATAGTGQVALNWQASTDNVGVTGYRVFRGTTQIASLGAGATSYTDTGLAPGPYSYTVRAVDAAGNLSDPSNTAERDRAGHDQADAARQPHGHRRHRARSRSAGRPRPTTSESPATGCSGARRRSRPPARAPPLTPTPASPRAHTATPSARWTRPGTCPTRDTAGATVADTTKPTPPGNLTATAGTRPGRAHLAGLDATTSESPATACSAGTTQIATLGPGATSYTDTGLAPGPYSYTVRAVDAAGNLSDPSNPGNATVPDTTKPEATRQISPRPPAQGRSRWPGTAASDDVGVTGYRVYRGGDRDREPGRLRHLAHGHRPRPRHVQLHGAGPRRGRSTCRPRPARRRRPFTTPRTRASPRTCARRRTARAAST